MVRKEYVNIANLHRFAHAAMAGTFEIFIVCRDPVYSRQAAQAAFNKLDRIEADLSRFIENSDVSRINSLSKGQILQIGLCTFECLKICMEMTERTGGAFDIAFGSTKSGSNLLKLDEENHTIELLENGVKIDLGAIGKGFAADRMGQLLGQWSIDTALISAGESTILPIGIPEGLPGWPVTISYPTDNHILKKIYLANTALSASGLQKGPHIINPRTGKPAKGKLACWGTAKTAAMADALSTAFMVMTTGEIRQFCKNNPDTKALLIGSSQKGKIIDTGLCDECQNY